ncbi:MAG: M48 family metallopeptidase [Nitrospina sp.]|nr:M48 family metallopeptidase [Nitrospina sp.]
MKRVQYVPRLPDENVNVTDSSPLKDFVILLTGLLGIITAVYVLLGLAVDWAVERMDAEMENRVFGDFQFDIPLEGRENKRSAILQRMVNDLNRNCTRLPAQFKVYAVDDEMINAVALPGGTIIVFGGLLDIMESENALAMVLGHELGHFHNRDHLKGVGRTLVLMVISTLVLGPNNILNNWMEASLTLTQTAYSRGQESKADAFGLQALNCKYGHVSGATQFFKTMSEKHNLGKVEKFFASHPADQDRIANIKALAQQQGFGEGELTPLPEGLRKKSK